MQCVAALLDFAYLARRPEHDTSALAAMQESLDRFHRHRVVFQRVGVRDDNFSLPRQHSLVHYVRSIQLFGSPNGLSSSITENKHIHAVKRPWRASSRHDALGQILLKNDRLLKISSARSEFGARGMLDGDVLVGDAYVPALPAIPEEGDLGQAGERDRDGGADDAEESDTIVEMAAKPCTHVQFLCA